MPPSSSSPGPSPGPSSRRIPGLSFDLEAGLAAGLEWRPTREPGVAWIPLHLEAEAGGRGTAAEGEQSGDATVLIRMDPGRGYPAHRHIGPEQVLVLAGGYRDEGGTWRAGDWVRYEAGSVHAPVALGDARRDIGPENPVCVLYAVARGGVELLG